MVSYELLLGAVSKELLLTFPTTLGTVDLNTVSGGAKKMDVGVYWRHLWLDKQLERECGEGKAEWGENSCLAKRPRVWREEGKHE